MEHKTLSTVFFNNIAGKEGKLANVDEVIILRNGKADQRHGHSVDERVEPQTQGQVFCQWRQRVPELGQRVDGREAVLLKNPFGVV